MLFYTLSGELVADIPEVNNLVEWDGRNKSGKRVSTGVYFYVIQQGGKVHGKGKILVQNSS